MVPSLVIGKAKLSPLKTVTLPCLQLLACLLSALRLEKSLWYYCWSDSMVALSRIKADPSWWKAFVANRVVEIQSLTSPDRWFHCSGVENPADLLTRGLTSEELIFLKVWLQGPKFLVERRSDEVDLNHQQFCVLWWLRKQLALFSFQLTLVVMCSRWRDG